LKPSNEQQDWVLVARILRPRGNKGEVLAELFTDFSARFRSLRQMHLRRGQDEPRPAALKNFWVDRNHPASFISKAVVRSAKRRSCAGWRS